MKVIVFLCLVAAALAQSRLARRPLKRVRQVPIPTFDEARQYQLQAFDGPPQVRQRIQPQVQQHVQQQVQQPTFVESRPTPERRPSVPGPQTFQPQPQRAPVEPEQETFSRGSNSRAELSESRKRDRDAVITSFTNEHTDGGARHSYKADNGLEREETIQLREVVTLDEYGEEVVKTVPVFKGSFQFLMDDGSLVTRSYTTDETGRLIWKGSDLPRERPAPQPQPADVYE